MSGDRSLHILFVSNLWPPHAIGGYELGARDIADRLVRRGHRVTVLTSTFGVGGPQREGAVHRLLHETVWNTPLAPRALLRESLESARAVRRVRRFLAEHRFDLVYVFSTRGLNAAVVQTLCDAGPPAVAYVSDDWAAAWPYLDHLFAQWMRPGPGMPAARRIALVLARRALRRAGVLTRTPSRLPIAHVQFVSRYVRALASPLAPVTQEIIPWGIEVERFSYRERSAAELTNWLFVGQIEEHKGPQTAIEAVRLLRAQGQPITLTLVGNADTAFSRRLRERVTSGGLGDHIRFRGSLAREALPAEAYDRGGLLVFPTTWEEPFSITLLEAFASGLPVLATLTGGTGEIVRHGETATVFSAGNARHLAAQWYHVSRHPQRTATMAARARAIVERHLQLDAMVDRVEAHLVAVASGSGNHAAPVAVTRHPWEPADTPVDLPTRALEPDANDATWLAGLWRDLAVQRLPRASEPEVDSTPDRLFPIVFPDSETFHRNCRRYLHGQVLNAGAGTVPMDAGTTQIRLDIQAKNRPHLCADLHNLPFLDATFDGVFSVAVLEHCRRPWIAMRELHRVLRAGGHCIVAVPFMQPAHANPDDYLRCTADGLQELALDAGFTIVERGAENSVQHTVGWILWELLRHHPRHRYLATDDRVQHWFDGFTRRPGRIVHPTLGDGYYVVGRRAA